MLSVRAKSFRKKFKTALITSFILLLNSSYYKHEFFNHYSLFITNFFKSHNFFQLSQFFSHRTIFFNYHNFFQLSQFFPNNNNFFNYYNLLQLTRCFSIIMTFFNYYYLFLLQSFLLESLSISLHIVTLFL